MSKEEKVGGTGEEKETFGLDALNVRQFKFFMAYVEKGTLTAAAESVGTYANKNSAHRAGHSFWKSIKRKVDVELLMESVGLSKVRIFEALNKGLEAKFVKPMVVDKKLVEAGPYIDHPTRVKAAETAAKIAGLTVSRVEVSGPDGGDIPMGNIELSNRILFILSDLEKRAASGKPTGS
jgi:hypothetical protein